MMRGSGRPSAIVRLAGVLGVLLAALLATTSAARAAGPDVRVAVAANFAEAAREIARRFETATGHAVAISIGATGALYAQIANGAPYDVYLAADRERPARAVTAGLAVADSRRTYAVGRLALYSREPGRALGPGTLRDETVGRLAIANPETAPYGRAAVEVLRALGVYGAVAPRLVRGSSIAQAYQFVATGNAELGLVALSQVASHEKGSRWLVPSRLHTPVAQDAVLLQSARDNPAARAFIAFLGAPEARAVVRHYGYTLPSGSDATGDETAAGT